MHWVHPVAVWQELEYVFELWKYRHVSSIATCLSTPNIHSHRCDVFCTCDATACSSRSSILSDPNHATACSSRLCALSVLPGPTYAGYRQRRTLRCACTRSLGLSQSMPLSRCHFECCGHLFTHACGSREECFIPFRPDNSSAHCIVAASSWRTPFADLVFALVLRVFALDYVLLLMFGQQNEKHNEKNKLEDEPTLSRVP